MKITKSKNEKIWKTMLEGDSESFSLIFKKQYKILYNYAFSICHNEELVKDSIQELFIYIWEKRNSLAQVKSVHNYLIISLRRIILKSLKIRVDENENSKNLLIYLPKEAFSAQDMLILKESTEQTKTEMENALNKIPVRMREALYLKTYISLSYKEISVIMKISPQVARNYVSESFHRLRNILS